MMKIEDLRKLRQPVDEKCQGCKKIEVGAEVLKDGNPIKIDACAAYIDPPLRWRLGDCGLASHMVIEETKKAGYKPGKFGKKRRNR